jgi:hypothetical protein
MKARVRIGPRLIEANRTSVKPFEAAFVLRCSEAEVRRMTKRGELHARWAGNRCEVDGVDLAERLGGDQLASSVLAAILGGDLDAPRAATPASDAPSLTLAIPALRRAIWR